MAFSIKKMIPLWIKCPVTVYLQQKGKLPCRVISCNILRSFTQNIHCSPRIRKKANQMAQTEIYQYLTKRYGKLAKQLLMKHDAGICDTHCPIWIFWWQGEQHAPYIIRTCVEHIRKKAGQRTVCIVDESNYLDYASIPEHIKEKFLSGKISITHFSDYLRMNLLYRYGGLWIDGSIFVQQQIHEEVFSVPVWTIRNPNKDEDNISGWNWTIGVMGGWKKNALFYAVSELLSCYWKDHDIIVDYFVMDYFMKLAYDSNEFVQLWIDSVEPSNEQFYYLQDHANYPTDGNVFTKEIVNKTWMFKISWKGRYNLCAPDGSDTIYAQWKREYGLSVEDDIK